MKERLKELRKTLGLKQRELAARLGVTVGIVGGWECGRDDIPKTRIYQICKEYNVRERWLVDGEGEMFEPTADKSAQYVDWLVSLYDDLSPEFQGVFRRVARDVLGADIPEDDAPDSGADQRADQTAGDVDS